MYDYIYSNCLPSIGTFVAYFKSLFLIIDIFYQKLSKLIVLEFL